MNKLFLTYILIFTCVNHFTAQGIDGKVFKDSLNLDGLQRSYQYYVPKSINPNPDLIFVLHGATMTNDLMQTISGKGFNELADKHKNAIIIYPQGYKNYWNDCRKLATYEAKLKSIDDVKFITKISEVLRKKLNAARSQLFVVGYSNGGHMTYKLAKEKPNLFKGFAAIGANLPSEANNDCKSTNVPVSMLVSNGTSDPINPFFGGKVESGDGKDRGSVLSTKETINYWIELNKDMIPKKRTVYLPDVVEEDNSVAVRESYHFENGLDVVLLKVINGGHHFNNSKFLKWPEYLGNVNRDINVPEIIWKFFKSR